MHDSSRHQTDVIGQSKKLKSNFIYFNGILSDTNSYFLNTNIRTEPDQYSLNRPIFVMGDVHGDYYGMIDLLQKGNVIDEKLNWKWGSGHLVFLGDIVDRGENVTECLWLIYKLERQARKEGGYVHYLLGNHEIMIMTKDYRYLADKYFYMNDQLGIDFSRNYDQNSFFGKWLSSKNSLVKIGPYLFLHAGLSYESFLNKYSIPNMNSTVRQYLKNPKAKTFSDTIHWLLGDTGPFWYRGYNAIHDSVSIIKSSQLDSILKFYDVKTIFVGHTHTPKIKRAFNGRVVLMDVPYYLDEADPEAIEIDSQKIKLFRAINKTLIELDQ
jgi:predicted MPP superfamily phosphohydrolase